ncbi:MAG: hypothetical protein VCA36_03065, partial [Opitutales bacterium]
LRLFHFYVKWERHIPCLPFLRASLEGRARESAKSHCRTQWSSSPKGAIHISLGRSPRLVDGSNGLSPEGAIHHRNGAPLQGLRCLVRSVSRGIAPGWYGTRRWRFRTLGWSCPASPHSTLRPPHFAPPTSLEGRARESAAPPREISTPHPEFRI